MTTGRLCKVRIAILLSPIVFAIVGGIILTRPPFGFVSGAKLWLAQRNPNDPNEVWLFYAHPDQPYGIIDDARKELGLEPTHEIRKFVPAGTRGARIYNPYTELRYIEGLQDHQHNYVGLYEASFFRDETQVLIQVVNPTLIAGEMLGYTGPWPKDHTLIAIRRPANALDTAWAWVASRQWRGLSGSAETEVFKAVENSQRAQEQFMREMRERQAENLMAEQRAKAKRKSAGPGQAKLP